jgi:hypothetical protein
MIPDTVQQNSNRLYAELGSRLLAKPNYHGLVRLEVFLDRFMQHAR